MACNNGAGTHDTIRALKIAQVYSSLDIAALVSCVDEGVFFVPFVLEKQN